MPATIHRFEKRFYYKKLDTLVEFPKYVVRREQFISSLKTIRKWIPGISGAPGTIHVWKTILIDPQVDKYVVCLEQFTVFENDPQVKIRGAPGTIHL